MPIGSWLSPVVNAMPRVTGQMGRVAEQEDASPAPAVDAKPEAVLGQEQVALILAALHARVLVQTGESHNKIKATC
ncbi:hypothetical protein Save01_04079 [Streptomyces avermitilis]|uniref:Uncharacterized protein n=1 Tax=Streptomyces avermitilis TaxID=33903 RepID=A0A4D4N787_STRAX|nr:hypothetical protein SAVMC3_06980 [Streptomyces avermitilis]GDY69566.1 hypothetical protein SAV14893_089590 [Streptomyces avermitilis]GDY79824.1 hypothetical protein SAV31267_093090 [Streptomyces avermitilis]